MSDVRKNIIVPNTVLSLNDPNATSVYIAAYYLLPHTGETNLFSLNSVAYLFYGEKYTKDRVKEIRSAMKTLTPVCGFRKLHNDDYLINYDDNFIVKEGAYFINLPSDYFRKILHSGNRNRFSLIHHLCCMMDSCDYNFSFTSPEGEQLRKIVGIMPQLFFSKKYGVAPSTVAGYNQDLQNMDILYMIRVRYDPMTEHPTSNIYSLVENKKYADKYFRNNNYIRAEKQSKYSNYLRSLAQRYNRFMNNPESRDFESAEKLLKDLYNYNESHFEKRKNTKIIEMYLDGTLEEAVIENMRNLTEIQKQKIELGLATPQDFLEESLAE